MAFTKKEKEAYTVLETATIKEVMVAISGNQRGAVIVVGAEGHYLGVVSDGDIRRALIAGGTEFTPIEKIVNTNASTLIESATDADIEEVFTEKPGATLVPLVTKDNLLSLVAVRD